jgi:hypothetical protein
MIEMLHQQNLRTFLATFFSGRCLWSNQRALVDKLGVLELRWGRTIDQKWPQYLGHFLCHDPKIVTNNQ